MAYTFKENRYESMKYRRCGRKYLVASLDASLKRMGLDYVDIFYHLMIVMISTVS